MRDRPALITLWEPYSKQRASSWDSVVRCSYVGRERDREKTPLGLGANSSVVDMTRSSREDQNRGLSRRKLSDTVVRAVRLDNGPYCGAAMWALPLELSVSTQTTVSVVSLEGCDRGHGSCLERDDAELHALLVSRRKKKKKQRNALHYTGGNDGDETPECR